MGVEDMGGIWSDIETSLVKVADAILFADMEVKVCAIARAREDRERMLEYKVDIHVPFWAISTDLFSVSSAYGFLELCPSGS